MLNYTQLIDFERSVRDRQLLCVYVNGTVKDPAERQRWRLDLRHALDNVERSLEPASHAERETFRSCRMLAMKRLEAFEATVGAPGWVMFLAPEGELHESRLAVTMPTRATWGTGASVAPYIRAIKESRPVIAAIVDARKGRLFRYVDGQVGLLDTVRAHPTVEKPNHMSAPPRRGFHVGTRGATGADAAQRELRNASDHMIAEVVDRLTRLAAADEWVIVGGIATVANTVMDRLPPSRALRASVVAIDVHATDAQIAEVARHSASSLRDAADVIRVNDALEGAEWNARGVAGPQDTVRALGEKRVRELFFTGSYAQEHATDIDTAVRLAFDSGAEVEHVSGVAAARLDQGGGIAATLWYAVASEGRAHSTLSVLL